MSCLNLNEIIRVFISICPWHCERNSCHNVKTFLLSSGFPVQIVTHIWRAKAKICSTFAFEFFLKFWTLVGSIQSSFLFSFQKYKFFWNRTKIDVFTMFFPWNYFLCARIPSFVNKMWRYCENNSDVIWYCESQCERNSSHIVRRLWGNCEWRWIPLISSHFVYHFLRKKVFFR